MARTAAPDVVGGRRVILLGLTGYRQSGKSTVGRFLQSYGFTPYAFADALRAMAYAINPIISLRGAPPASLADMDTDVEWRYAELVDLLGYETAKAIPDMRRFLQHLGTDGLRATFGPNVWVRLLAERLDVTAPARAVITDVRFASEAAWISERGGTLWRVERPGVGGRDPHVSEKELVSLPVARTITAPSTAVLEVEVRTAVAAAAWDTVSLV